MWNRHRNKDTEQATDSEAMAAFEENKHDTSRMLGEDFTPAEEPSDRGPAPSETWDIYNQGVYLVLFKLCLLAFYSTITTL